MRRSLYASGSIHALLLGSLLFGDALFDRREAPEIEVTGVTLMSSADLEAISGGELPAIPEAPAAPSPSQQAANEETAEADTPPAPEEVAVLAPPPGAPDADVSDRPTPEAAPRVAMRPTPRPERPVPVAAEVIERPAESEEPSEEPEPQVEEAAPEEATTEIVTEAEQPAAAPRGPTASIRPVRRPSRPAPAPEPEAPREVAAAPEPEPTPDPAPEPAPTPDPAPEAQTDPLASAIAGAVAEAVGTGDPGPASIPAGPPLSQGVRDGFRVAVGNCWNVGTTSTDAMQTTVVVAFEMQRNGRPIDSTLRMIEYTGPSQAAANTMFEAARRAILRCQGNGYDLPEESFGRWQNVELVFNPEGMRMR